jgi:hypothetical protein
LAFRPPSDPYLAAALAAGLVACALVVAVASLIVLLRLSSRREQARWDAFVRQWRPALLAAVMAEGDAFVLPRMAWRDRRHFMRLWLYLHESLRGVAAERLNDVARTLGAPELGRRMLVRDRGASRLLAVAALGRLQHRPAWDDLLRTARSQDPVLSVQAARALAHIDPLAAAQQLMPLVLSRLDWDIARVADFLGNARQAYWLLLVRALPTARPREVVRGLRLAVALRLELPMPALNALLEQRRPPAQLCAALPLVREAATAPLVRLLLRHAAWAVREQSVLALGRIATRDDVPLFVAALQDERFEVRMASARALASLPFLRADDLPRLVPDGSPGQDVVRHVLAEQALA